MKARFGRQILKQQRLLRDERVRNRWRDGYDVDKCGFGRAEVRRRCTLI